MSTSTGKQTQNSALNDHYGYGIIRQTLFNVRVISFISCNASVYTDVSSNASIRTKGRFPFASHRFIRRFLVLFLSIGLVLCHTPKLEFIVIIFLLEVWWIRGR